MYCNNIFIGLFKVYVFCIQHEKIRVINTCTIFFVVNLAIWSILAEVEGVNNQCLIYMRIIISNICISNGYIYLLINTYLNFHRFVHFLI